MFAGAYQDPDETLKTRIWIKMSRSQHSSDGSQAV